MPERAVVDVGVRDGEGWEVDFGPVVLAARGDVEPGDMMGLGARSLPDAVQPGVTKKQEVAKILCCAWFFSGLSVKAAKKEKPTYDVAIQFSYFFQVVHILV